MPESTLSAFIGNARNRTFILMLSVLLAIAGTLPYANSYFEQKDLRVETERLRAECEVLESELTELLPRLDHLRTSAQRLDGLMVGPDQTEMFRESIIDKVRTTDCRLRNLTMGDRQERRWMQGDSALSDGRQFDSFGTESLPTDCVLQMQRVDLVASGAFQNIGALLAEIRKTDHLFHTNALEIEADTHGSTLTLHWEIRLLKLVHSPEENDWAE